MKTCPLCSDKVSTFTSADDVIIEMCSNQECIYPFNEEPDEFEVQVTDNRPLKSVGLAEGVKRKKESTGSSDKKKKKKAKKSGLLELKASGSPTTTTTTTSVSSIAVDMLFGSSLTPSSTSPQMPDLTLDILSQDSTWTTPVTPPDATSVALLGGAKQSQQSFTLDISASGIESLLFGDDPLLGTGSFDSTASQMLENDASFDAIFQS